MACKYLIKNKSVGSFNVPLKDGKKLPKGLNPVVMPKKARVFPGTGACCPRPDR